MNIYPQMLINQMRVRSWMAVFEDDTGHAQKACYAAYNEAVRAAYKTLSDSISDYFDENHEQFKKDILEVPDKFRPLKDYDRTLKIQKLVLRLALKTIGLDEHKIAEIPELRAHTNGRDPLSAEPALSQK